MDKIEVYHFLLLPPESHISRGALEVQPIQLMSDRKLDSDPFNLLAECFLSLAEKNQRQDDNLQGWYLL